LKDKQETCVAGGVKTGILDTHTTNSVVNVWTHTQTIGEQETCVAGQCCECI
jgi:hypothetical protein